MKKMADLIVPFSKPEIGKDEIAEVVDTLKSGWLTMGQKTVLFEKMFCDFIGQQVQCISVNSATSGLHLALEALGIGPGDEVITTTHTFTATAEVVRYLGADPVFVDIDLSTYGIDINQIEAKITKKTKAIIPVHYAGLALDMDKIVTLARKYNLKIVEDAAHALPSTFNSKLVGSNETDATVFSFYANKTITTGEGGMIVTRNPEIAERVKIMRLHGIDRNSYDRYQSTKPQWYYEVVAPGYKYNMTDLAASVGIHQLKKVNYFRLKREEIALSYSSKMQELPLILPPHPAKGDLHSWHLYSIRLSGDCRISRNLFIEKMFEHGIGCSVHYIPLHQQPYWKKSYNLKTTDYPNSQKLYETQVSLPIYPSMTDEQTNYVFNVIKKIL